MGGILIMKKIFILLLLLPFFAKSQETGYSGLTFRVRDSAHQYQTLIPSGNGTPNYRTLHPLFKEAMARRDSYTKVFVFDSATKRYGWRDYTTGGSSVDVTSFLDFSIGDSFSPSVGDSVLTNTGLVGKKISIIVREENALHKSTSSGYEFNNSSGTITFHPPFLSNERISIQARDSINTITLALEGTSILDVYPVASAAYSLRKTKSDYAGSAIKVRRSSDNTELDIGFVNGNFDTAALKTFTGANSAYVTTWYDQSGNARNLTQSTAGNQPRVVNAGVVEREGTQPTVTFLSASSTYLDGGDVLDYLGAYMNTFTVAKFSSAAEQTVYAKSIAAGVFGRYAMFKSGGSLTSLLIDNVNSDASASVSYSNTDLSLFEVYANRTTDSNQLKKNNSQIAVSTVLMVGDDTNTAYNFLMGAYNSALGGVPPFAGYYLDGKVSEMIFYLKNWDATKRLGITNNIRVYYSVY